ncbi:MAG TPA: hypothetical protein VJX94_23785 [Stellaceae bacterium]|nr:hypothetical protein [Stellaceae bacterium]
MDDNHIGEQASKVVSDLKEGIADAVGKASDMAGKARTTAADAAIDAGKKVSDVAAETHKQGVKAGDYLSQRTAEQPLLALLLAAAVGYGIAYLVHRR